MNTKQNLSDSLDSSAAIAFAEKLHSEGPYFFVAIDSGPNCKGTGIAARTFEANEKRKARDWIGEQNRDGMNLYISVAETKSKLNKKATRKDIASLSHLWVDIDPDYTNGQTVEEVVEKSQQELASGKDGVPPPTMIVFSGGGIQAYWRLETPLIINGDLDRANEVAKHNRYLEKVFGADHCHNVDRILRVPGTINWPNEKKRKLGREPVVAELLEDHYDRVYDIALFPQLEPEEKSKKQSNPATTEFVVPKDVERLNDINELAKWNVPDRIKQIIVDGRHADEGPKTPDDSRSAWLFDAVCGLGRCSVPHQIIYGIITDPAYKISESVLESGDPENYAKRQIERATSAITHPVLLEMNERHAVIENYGGKCVVTDEVYDPTLNRYCLAPQTFEHFKNRYLNRQVQVGCDANGKPKFVSQGKWWLEQPNRRTYKKVVFAPNQHVPDAYNLWKGFAVKPVAGDWSLFRGHLRDVICGGNDEYFSYLIRWLARCVLEPESSGQVAIVLRGGKGCGKSLFVETFGKLFGQHFLATTSAEHIAGRFNEHLQMVVVLFGDEAFFAGNKDHERTLKGLVTQDELSFEGKGRPVKAGRNHTHLLLASNSTWVVPTHGKERRFFVLDVSEAKTGDHPYFSAIAKQMKSGGFEAMLYDLLHTDLTDFEVRKFPQTAALREQQQESARFEESVMVEILTDGFTPDHEFHGCQPNEISPGGIRELAVKMGLVGSSEEKHSSYTRIGHFIRKFARAGTDGKPVSQRRHRENGVVDSRVTVYELRPLEELRQEFDYLVGPEGWPDSPSEWASAGIAPPF